MVSPVLIRVVEGKTERVGTGSFKASRTVELPDGERLEDARVRVGNTELYGNFKKIEKENEVVLIRV